MTGRRVAALLVAAGAVGVLTVVVAGIAGSHVARALATVPLPLIYLLPGLVAVRQQPEHLAARRLLALGALLALAFGVGYAYSAVVQRTGVPSWAALAVLTLSALQYASTVAPFALFAVFPDGSYSRPYERRLVRAAWLMLPVLLIVQAATQAPLRVNTPHVWLDGDVIGENPLAVPGAGALGALAAGLLGAGQLWSLVGVVVLVLRYRRAAPETRRQIAWPLYALALTVVALAVLGSQSARINRLPMWQGYLLFYPVLLLLPAGLLVGMLRHRVLDVNLVVRRSVIYGALWLLVAAGYTGVAAGLGLLAAREVPLGLALVLTILATVVATPLRHRLEKAADRLVFGPRNPGYPLLDELDAHLEASLAPAEVAASVALGVQGALAAQWVRVVVGEPPRTLATAGEVVGPPVLGVPLTFHAGEPARLECGPKREGAYRAGDELLLRTLGRQAALGLWNAELSAELSQRLADLAASRARLIQAEEAGRRRLERDLHDGVQQQLVALLAQLSMARNQLRRDPELGQRTLTSAQAEARSTLESLQELVRGIHPAVLTDSGLLDAVAERLTRLPLVGSLRSDGLSPGMRLAPDVEAGAYFFVSEALTNVLKHAAASEVEVSVRLADGCLHLEVDDDGRGFAVDHTPTTGLRGLADRIEALGGRVSVSSRRGEGTTVTATLPVREVAHA